MLRTLLKFMSHLFRLHARVNARVDVSLFVCVEVLPPNGVMSSMVSLANHRLSPLSG